MHCGIVIVDSRRVASWALSMQFIYDWARDCGTLEAHRTVPAGCGRPAGGASGRVHMCHYGRLLLVVIVAVLWLSASHDPVVVVRDGSFPPWAAAAAARRL
eukprot:scaffold169320_cov37-Attheya_sp.AAC.1